MWVAKILCFFIITEFTFKVGIEYFFFYFIRFTPIRTSPVYVRADRCLILKDIFYFILIGIIFAGDKAIY